jgi:hypothetical protein
MAARTNPAIKAKLLAKLDVSPQRLSQLVNRRKRDLPMSTPHAVYTIAHENGIDIAKDLGADETAEVRGLVASLNSGGQRSDPAPAAAKTARRKAATPKNVSVKIAGADVGKIPALKKSHADDAKRMSERVYPLLYLFENSARDLIEAVLRDKYGKDWWTTAVPKKVQETAAKHKADEAKTGWHGTRGGREIDYVFLNDLWAIIRHNWNDFKDLFPDQAWIQTLITNDMNVSRRVLAHMTALAADDIAGIEASFRKWVKQLQAIEDRLP